MNHCHKIVLLFEKIEKTKKRPGIAQLKKIRIHAIIIVWAPIRALVRGVLNPRASCSGVQLKVRGKLHGTPGLVVMGDDSSSRGREFKSWRCKLDGHDIFHIDLL